MQYGLLGAGAAALMATTAHAQIDDSIRGEASEANHFIETPEDWEHPRTSWGAPDISVKTDMRQAGGVPLERCATSYEFGEPQNCETDDAWLAEEEFESQMEEWRNRVDRSRQLAAEGEAGAALQAGVIDPSRPQRQTSLIVDPADGQLPEVTPEAKRRALEMSSGWALPGEDPVFDNPEDFDSWDRCITRGMPSSMMPYRYNGGFRIKQAPGRVVLELEMIHDARTVYMDDREAPPSDVRQHMGFSRGRWEGNTLVIETTNYKVGPPMINLAVVGSPPGNRFPYSRQMKTTERIVRLNDDWWLYEITTEDPEILSEPFTVRYPLRRNPDYLWPEYACHEDNVTIPNYIETNRHERQNPSPEPEQEPVEVSAEVADSLDGRWVGNPPIHTLDLSVELQFTENEGDTVNGRLIGTNLGRIDKPLRNFQIEERVLRFQLPNTQPWSFAGELTQDGTIEGVLSSSQGSLPVTFRPEEEASR